MAAFRICIIGAILVGRPVWSAETVALREQAKPGQVAHVTVELTAEGRYRPGGAEAKPLAMKVQTRFDFVERVGEVGPDGAARRVVRKVNQAAAAINGEVRPLASQLRPEVSLLIAERRRDGSIISYSPSGPLTRSELELVQGVGDPLALPGLLPEKPVALGDRWVASAEAARALSGYDALALNRLEATLEALDAASAKVRLKGEVRGAAMGGEGTIGLDGTLSFDRQAGRIERLVVQRNENRKPGPVEAGLEMKSTLTVERREAVTTPPELSDTVVDGLPPRAEQHLELLVFSPPDGKYTLLHDRDWHIFWDDTRQAVLKRLDHGEIVAQCNLAIGPNAGKGRHQDLEQFRDDIRRALGRRFVQILGAGEVEGAPGGGFRYRVAVQGREGDAGILWYYYLVASPEGDQLLATFTLGEAQAKAFGDQDLQLIGSLEWKGAAAGGGGR
ncbi:MAG: hypothetical protein IRY99_10940 [Isosphaeraceae bacterium]|nr:hypothetical protein [Isosphaeraceae bacterium]